MMLTLLPEGDHLLFLVSAPARASEAGANLLGRKTVVWSSSTMSDYSVEVATLVLIVAKVEHTLADYS